MVREIGVAIYTKQIFFIWLSRVHKFILDDDSGNAYITQYWYADTLVHLFYTYLF